MEQGTSNKIKYLSYLMAFFVVMIHTYNVGVYELTGAFAGFERFVSSLAAFAVPTFFAISGYLFFRGYEPKDTLAKWKRRVFSLLIPYLVWNLIGYFYLVIPSYIPALAAHINHPMTFSWKSFFTTLLMGYSVNWFLRCLILFVLLSPLFYFLLKNRYVGVLTLAALFVLGVLFSKYFLYGAFYFCGAYLAMQGGALVEKRYPLPQKLIAIGLLTAIAAFCAFSGFHIPSAISAILLLIGIALVWIAGDFLAISGKVPACLNISFFLYVAHEYLLEALEKGFYILLGKTFYGAVIDYFVAPLITVTLLTAISFLLRRSKVLWLLLAGSRG